MLVADLLRRARGQARLGVSLGREAGRRSNAKGELRRQAATDWPAPDARDGQGSYGSQGACRTDGLQRGTDRALGAWARAALPDRADEALPCARRYPRVAAVMGAPRPLITPASQAQCGCFLLPS